MSATGAGMFGLAGSFVAGSATFGVAIGDLNGDGKPDLVAANQASNTVSVLLATGPSGFSPSVNYATGLNCVSVAIGDLNIDGIPDLVAADVDISGISVLLGNGNGTFQPKSNYHAGGNGTGFVTIADLNGDGKARAGGVELFHHQQHLGAVGRWERHVQEAVLLGAATSPTGVGIATSTATGGPTWRCQTSTATTFRYSCSALMCRRSR